MLTLAKLAVLAFCPSTLERRNTAYEGTRLLPIDEYVSNHCNSTRASLMLEMFMKRWLAPNVNTFLRNASRPHLRLTPRLNPVLEMQGPQNPCAQSRGALPSSLPTLLGVYMRRCFGFSRAAGWHCVFLLCAARRQRRIGPLVGQPPLRPAGLTLNPT